MATESQNLTFDVEVIAEVKSMALSDKRSKSSMFNVLVREALEARYEAGFQTDNNAQSNREEGE